MFSRLDFWILLFFYISFWAKRLYWILFYCNKWLCLYRLKYTWGIIDFQKSILSGIFQKGHSSVRTPKGNGFENSLREYFLEVDDTPGVFQSIEAKPFVAIKKDSVQSLRSKWNVKKKKYWKIEPRKHWESNEFSLPARIAMISWTWFQGFSWKFWQKPESGPGSGFPHLY